MLHASNALHDAQLVIVRDDIVQERIEILSGSAVVATGHVGVQAHTTSAIILECFKPALKHWRVG